MTEKKPNVATDYAAMDYDELSQCKERIKLRIGELAFNPTARGIDKSSSSLTNNADKGATAIERGHVHWDFVMKEMVWLANDFMKERERLKAKAKKAVKVVESYHKTKEARDIKKVKDEALAVRKIATKASRDVRKFWLKINKVVSFKQKTEADEIRQKAMDKHLVYLVKQTERYTNMLAQQMQQGVDDSSVGSGYNRYSSYSEDDGLLLSEGENSRSSFGSSATGKASKSSTRHMHNCSSHIAVDNNGKRKLEAPSNDDLSRPMKRVRFSYDDMPDHGQRSDETVVSGDAHLGDYFSFDEEGNISGLNEDGDSDDSNDAYRKNDENSEVDVKKRSTFNDDSDDDEYVVDAADDCSDDETTLREQEAIDGMSGYADEIAALKEEGDLPVEVLKAKYGFLLQSSSQGEEDDDEDDNPAGENSENSGVVNNQGTISNSNSSGDENSEDDDEDFVCEEELDDETTLLEQEACEQAEAIEYSGELELLRLESEIPIERLREIYKQMEVEESNSEQVVNFEADHEDNDDDDDSHVDDDNHNDHEGNVCSSYILDKQTIPKDAALDTMDSHDDDNSDNDGSDDDEYIFNDIEQVDDETTLREQEEAEGDQDYDYAKEIEELRASSEIPIEKLRELYALPYGDDSDGVEDPHESKPSDWISGHDDSDFQCDEDERDDETTIRAQEELDGASNYEEELELLKQEGEIPIEQLRAMYSGKISSEDDEDGEVLVDTSKESSINAVRNDSDDSDEEYMDIEAGIDDETTMKEQEEIDGTANYSEELAQLKAESELPIEKLREMYGNYQSANSDESDDDEYEEQFVGNLNESTTSDKANDLVKEQSGEEDVDAVLSRLEAADLAARSFSVERPYILTKSLKLREYQHIGLNWLVSLHERRLNGILADEMGLGKTIQTIALLAHLAVHRGIWGPHLIIVPTSCIVNWETELKRFCPVFKVLTYFGSAKARKHLRTGWSKTNSFHVCITSYQIVVQDSKAFRPKRWYYMILDEAHNIKNFKSKRWQTLLNYNTQRRLLLTGTPLQNNLMELWSLMHFLMPHIFRSRKEFSYWFSNPLSSMVEGNRGVNNDLISRLHSIMRPFLLRRLKKDVAKQLPGKYEHLVMCKLSKRQQYLYEEFMSRSSTRSSLSGGNYLGMMNILMQLRKVCNHPDLFEPRPIESPFQAGCLHYQSHPIFVRTIIQPPLERLSEDLLRYWDYDLDDFARSSLENQQVVWIDDQSLHRPLPPHSMFLQCDAIKNKECISFVEQLLQRQRNRTNNRRLINSKLLAWRCSRPRLSLNWRMVKAVTIDSFTSKVIKARCCHRAARWVTAAWYDLIRTYAERLQDAEDIIEHFVFVQPSVLASQVQLVCHGELQQYEGDIFRCKQLGSSTWRKVKEQLESSMQCFYRVKVRQRIFFPDRKLVQFDSGKLQALAKLLRDLKKGGHKCLIFTQMSKMLDVLEIFLNLNNHTFVRLDGSTSIDRRQKLMDRFNSDPKLFCFILSTRSGGLGINLTGADSVIFYDTDWNPAMDAQAQDRAHRIGQTRDVHIYRMVCASTVEENILTKARQKRHLDFLVMTEGNFSETSLFSAGGLKDVLGAPADDNSSSEENFDQNQNGASANAMEAAMLAAEDDEDISAMRAAKHEAISELQEFDENDTRSVTSTGTKNTAEDDDAINGEGEEEDGVDQSSSSTAVELISTEDTAANEEKDIEKEFASWQATVGFDFKALESALRPIERYALRIRTEIDPYYSMFFLSDQAQLEALISSGEGGSLNEQWNVEEIEREKEEEELRALADGELLAARIGSRREASRLKSWFAKERSHRVAQRRLRSMTGAAWILTVSDGIPFWYNEDTGAASYSTPTIIVEQEHLQYARDMGFCGLSISIVIRIFSFLQPYPDRMQSALVCARWAAAGRHETFHKYVLPVESGARDALKFSAFCESNKKKRSKSFSKDYYPSLEKALEASLPGDTIVLGVGHHWENNLNIDKPVRIVAEKALEIDALNAAYFDQHIDIDECTARCIVELLGGISVSPSTRCLLVYGVLMRRPRKVIQPSPMLQLSGVYVTIYGCKFNGEGSKGCLISATNEAKVKMYRTDIFGSEAAGILALNSQFLMSGCAIFNNRGNGISLLFSDAFLKDCWIVRNEGYGIFCTSGMEIICLHHCEISYNAHGVFPLKAYNTMKNGDAEDNNNKIINMDDAEGIVFILKCIAADANGRTYETQQRTQKNMKLNDDCDASNAVEIAFTVTGKEQYVTAYKENITCNGSYLEHSDKIKENGKGESVSIKQEESVALVDSDTERDTKRPRIES